MPEFEILIIGAGASGLAAARELSKSGKRIAVVEARDRLGGRINSSKPQNFSKYIEVGAEFIHGDLPVSLSILKEAQISYHPMGGKTCRVKNGKLSTSEEFIEGYDSLISKLNELKADIPFSEFLDKYFSDKKYTSLRKSVTRFAEGYDAANINKVSSFALREEWTTEDAADSYRIDNGYIQLINFLANECKKHDCPIYLSTIVKRIKWVPGQIEIVDDTGNSLTAGKVLITIPLGILCSEADSMGYINFTPGIPDKLNAAGQIGFGTVIKLFLEFKEAFWNAKKYSKQGINQMPGLNFLLTDADIPTWWTQLPNKIPLLTGWLAGPKAEKLQSKSNEELINLGIKSLYYIFNTNISFIQHQLKAQHAVNWLSDPFSLGAYAYSTVESKEARKILSQSVTNTIFFAGEALYEGPAMGTVEAALVSGINAANDILRFK